LKAKIRSCKEDNDQIIQSQERSVKVQEKQEEVNAIILQSFSNFQRQGPLKINHGQEDKTNGTYGASWKPL